MLKATAPFLTFIDHSATHTRDRSTDRNWWTALRESAQQFFTSLAGSHEPHVSRIHHRDGRVTWAVHDPMTGYRDTFATEQDVRIWLEKRYYQ